MKETKTRYNGSLADPSNETRSVQKIRTKQESVKGEERMFACSLHASGSRIGMGVG